MRFWASSKASWARFGGVLNASLGRVFRLPEASKTMCFTSVLTFSDWDTCIHAGGCGSGVCVQCGSLGKHVVKVFRTPEDDAGGPKRPLGTFLGRLGGG